MTATECHAGPSAAATGTAKETPRRSARPDAGTLAEDARLAALLMRGRAGDQRAYHDFLKDLAPRLRRRVRARGLPETEAEDLVQDILVSIHTSRATWDAAKPVLPWVAAITRYRIADHYRHRARSGRLSEEILRQAETGGGRAANNTSDEVMNGLAMQSALKDLTRTERQAFTLVRLRGFSMDEAAGWCGSTAGAVKVAVHRAARKLQAMIGEGRL